MHRREGVSWWRDEELSLSELTDAVALYEEIKPSIIMTHDAPFGIIEQMKMPRLVNGPIYPTRTTQALEAMLKIHRPAFWIFGHWHYSRSVKLDKTTFICVGMDSHTDITV